MCDDREKSWCWFADDCGIGDPYLVVFFRLGILWLIQRLLDRRILPYFDDPRSNWAHPPSGRVLELIQEITLKLRRHRFYLEDNTDFVD